VTALAAADQRRLVQLLAMSAASNDGEALNSIRLAHALVRRHGLNLTEALEGIGGAKAEALDLARLAQLERAAFERGRLAALDEARAAAVPRRSGYSWCGLPHAKPCLPERPAGAATLPASGPQPPLASPWLPSAGGCFTFDKAASQTLYDPLRDYTCPSADGIRNRHSSRRSPGV
jgi:hypothetical protein